MSLPFLFHNKKGENTGSRSIHNNNQWLFKQNKICKKNSAPYTGWWIQHPWKHIIWPFLSFVKHFCVGGCWKCTRVVNSAPCVGCRISFWNGPLTLPTNLHPRSPNESETARVTYLKSKWRECWTEDFLG